MAIHRGLTAVKRGTVLSENCLLGIRCALAIDALTQLLVVTEGSGLVFDRNKG